MDKDKLDRITALITDIKELDSKITDIQSCAEIVAGCTIDAEIDLKVKNLDKKPKIESEVVYDQPVWSGFQGLIESLKKNPPILNPWGVKSTDMPRKEYDISLCYSLDNVAILKILGIILQEIQDEKVFKIKRLKELGVNI